MERQRGTSEQEGKLSDRGSHSLAITLREKTTSASLKPRSVFMAFISLLPLSSAMWTVLEIHIHSFTPCTWEPSALG